MSVAEWETALMAVNLKRAVWLCKARACKCADAAKQKERVES